MGHAGQKPVDIWGKNSLGQGGESSKCKGPAAEMCVICVSPCSGPTVAVAQGSGRTVIGEAKNSTTRE